MKLSINLNPKYGFRYNQIKNPGFGMSLLTEDNQVLLTPFDCKDYIQDIFWSENTGNNASLYGLEWKPGMFNIQSETFKLILFGNDGLMESKSTLLETYINYFDDAQGFYKTMVHTTEDVNSIVVEFSKEWTSSGPLLSAFTSIVRMAGSYAGESPVEYIKKLSISTIDPKTRAQTWTPKPLYIMPEVNRMSNIGGKLMALLNGKKVESQWSDLKSVSFAHNTGIVGFNTFPVDNLDGLHETD